MEHSERQTILVLGMHRSGTSAVAGAFALLGPNPPVRMVPAAADNPAGFFEPLIAVGVNDWILHAGSSTWFDPLEFSIDHLSPQARRTADAMIVLSLLADFEHAPLPLLKDPRLCLLLELWLPGLTGMQFRPSAVLVLRHPAEVIMSLAQRDSCPAPVAASLWLHYMLTAEFATRSLPRHILPYDELLGDWRGCVARAARDALLTLPHTPDSVAPRMEEFLAASLRHHAFPGDAATSGPLGRLMDETYQALATLAREGAGETNLQRLDQLRAAFAEWRFQHSPLLAAMLAGSKLRWQRQCDLPPGWEQIARDAVSQDGTPAKTG
jgi:hypothetical protein